MKDPQIVAMEEARSFKGIGTDAEQDLADLRAKLEEFSWPRERTVDYLIVEALENASKTYFDLISQGRQLAHTFHHPVNRVNEERYHQKGMTFRRKAEVLRTRIPEEKSWQKEFTVTDLQDVVATAVNRIFGDITATPATG